MEQCYSETFKKRVIFEGYSGHQCLIFGELSMRCASIFAFAVFNNYTP